MRRFSRGVLVLGLFLGTIGEMQSAYIYFSEFTGGRIGRANLDGTGKVTLVSGQANPAGPSLDLAHGQMYWGGRGTMRRANLDGTGQTIVVSSPNGGTPALDLSSGRMYWGNSLGNIQRSNLDGSGQQVLMTGQNDGHAPVVDLVHGKIYWTIFGVGDVRRANLDGTGQETLVAGLAWSSLIALDVAGGKMYWTVQQANGDIRRANLDGTGQEILVRNQNSPAGIALDLSQRHLYWANYGGGDIRRANLDGSGEQIVITGLSGPAMITLDLVSDGPPVIQFAPQSQAALIGGPVTLAAGVTGLKPLFYQWHFNDVPLDNATNATLTLSNLTHSDAGSYRAVVRNSLGSAETQPAVLNVLPMILTAQTGNTNVWLGSNVTFRVAITSTVPVSCQWRLDNADIPGATNFTHAIINAQLIHEGEYAAVLVNSFGSITSAPARLVVFIKPTIIQHPASQTIVAGEDVTFEVEAIGSLPLTYEWRRVSTRLATNTVSAYTNAFTLHNVGTNQSGNYRAVVRNDANPTGVASTFAALTVLPAAPPLAVTEGPGDVAADGAILHGTVNPNGAPSAACFDYGVSATYGSQTPGLFLSKGSDVVPVSQTLTNLLAGTTYHYRLVATNHGGISLGADQSFTTAALLRIHHLELVGNGRVRLTFVGSNGTAYTVLASTNLVTWRALGTAAEAEPASFEFIDTEAAGHPPRFYRLVSP